MPSTPQPRLAGLAFDANQLLAVSEGRLVEARRLGERLLGADTAMRAEVEELLDNGPIERLRCVCRRPVLRGPDRERRRTDPAGDGRGPAAVARAVSTRAHRGGARCSRGRSPWRAAPTPAGSSRGHRLPTGDRRPDRLVRGLRDHAAHPRPTSHDQSDRPRPHRCAGRNRDRPVVDLPLDMTVDENERVSSGHRDA